MFSATRLLGGLVSHGFGRTARNALGGGGGMMGTAAKVAGVAAVGGAAYAAYRHYQAGGFGRGGPGLFGGGQPPAAGAPGGFGGAPAGPGGFGGGQGAGPGGFAGGQGGQGGAGWTDAAGAGFGGSSTGGAPPPNAPQAAPERAAPPQPTSAEEEQALLLVRAMIAAANIDGQIDAAERDRILKGAGSAGFGPEERQALETELANPHAPNVLLGQVRNPDLAAQFYLVTLLATDRDNDPERTYVAALPLILQLPPAKVGEIHQQLGVPVVA